ncbi:Uncharacterised protein [uncultured archaeon]|nr:Uncharacterised protein [uncultured archaeon]
MSSVNKLQSSTDNNSSVNSYIGQQGRLFYSEDDKVIRISDGETPGGIPINGGG